MEKNDYLCIVKLKNNKDMVKYIIRVVSPNSGVNGFVGEDNMLYYKIENARLFNREFSAFSHAKEMEKYWLNVRVESININIQ